MPDFVLCDDEGVLDPELFVHLSDAADRTKYPLWAGRPWTIYDPTGQAAYSSRFPKEA
ncbi:hypothetical protein [Gordonia sp. FQ]|uniref:hypothetical protein n=1 Tax=Gordonia sp. FQ TaxID=3446634 RepID=UPI003F84955E